VTEPIKLLIADDDPILLGSLRSLLGNRADLTLVAAVANGEQAVHAVQAGGIEVALLDVDMPKMDGIAAARTLHSACPNVTVVMFTAFEHGDSLRLALEAGARGFLTKDIPVDEVVQQIKRAHAGEVVMGPRPTAMLADSYAKRLPEESSEFKSVLEGLPLYLLEVLDLLILASTNREIASALNVSLDTARIYVSRLLQVTDSKNRSEVALRAVNCGYSPKATRAWARYG
jgi:Response regulator containing a CheY-like receiver domain and an HTH DNA-binding domain